MLTPQEKAKVKDVLGDGLGINKNINLAYFLNEINTTKEEVDELKTMLSQLSYNQKALEQKMDLIIELIRGH